MKRFYVVLAIVASCCSLVAAQDLPPEILADQYLLEATKAIEERKYQKAIAAYRKIEALNIEQPLEFHFFYGKLLVVHGTTVKDVLKGQSLLKKYVVRIKKDSEHYTPTLELLSAVTTQALLVAAEKGDTAAIKALIDAGADVNAWGEYGIYTPLQVAVEKGHIAAVKALIDAGANIHLRGKYRNSTPLHSAAEEGHVAVVKALIDAGANVNAYTREYYSTPLHYAAEQGHVAAVKALIDAGADVDAKDKSRWTPLQEAASKGHTEVVRILKAAEKKQSR